MIKTENAAPALTRRDEVLNALRARARESSSTGWDAVTEARFLDLHYRMLEVAESEPGPIGQFHHDAARADIVRLLKRAYQAGWHDATLFTVEAFDEP